MLCSHRSQPLQISMSIAGKKSWITFCLTLTIPEEPSQSKIRFERHPTLLKVRWKYSLKIPSSCLKHGKTLAQLIVQERDKETGWGVLEDYRRGTEQNMEKWSWIGAITAVETCHKKREKFEIDSQVLHLCFLQFLFYSPEICNNQSELWTYIVALSFSYFS